MVHSEMVRAFRSLRDDPGRAAALTGFLVAEHAEAFGQAQELVGLEQVHGVARTAGVAELIGGISLINQQAAGAQRLPQKRE